MNNSEQIDKIHEDIITTLRHRESKFSQLRDILTMEEDELDSLSVIVHAMEVEVNAYNEEPTDGMIWMKDNALKGSIEYDARGEQNYKLSAKFRADR